MKKTAANKAAKKIATKWRATAVSGPFILRRGNVVRLDLTAPDDPRYNRLVTLPYPSSAETMWRDDHLYDLVAVLGFNDDPVVAGRGSAIFLHLAKPDYADTHGCVALARDDALAALAQLRPGDAVVIR